MPNEDPPRCPGCGSGRTVGRGGTGAGHRFWECRGCGRKFTSLSGTVFESSKKALWRWVPFIRLVCFNVQLDACAELCGVSHQTAWERRHRVMGQSLGEPKCPSAALGYRSTNSGADCR